VATEQTITRLPVMLGHRGLSPQRNRQERAYYSRRGSPRKIVCSPLYPARIVGICWHAASTSTCALPIRPGEHIRHVFFPTDRCISLITPIDGRAGLRWDPSATKARQRGNC